MKKTIPILLFIGLLFIPQLAFAGLSEDCFPAVECDAGDDYYAGACQTHIEVLDDCGVPPADKFYAFSCDNGCYLRSNSAPNPCPGGVMVGGVCMTTLELIKDSSDNNIYKIFDNPDLTRAVYADCPDGETPVWDDTAHEWSCMIPAATASGVTCADGEVLSWNDAAGEWECGPKNFTYWSEGTGDANDIYYDTGDVGVGTDDPDYKLHVQNSTTFDSVNPDRFMNSADSREYYGLYSEAKGSSGDMGNPPLYYNIGIKGVATETNSHGNWGVWGDVANSGNSLMGAGVYGSASGDYMYGVMGISENHNGVRGDGADKGVYGVGDNYGVYGYSSSGKGVYGSSSSGYAGYFNVGDVYVGDNLVISDDLILSEFIKHNYDDDTYLQFESNTLNFIGGGKELFRARGTAQAYAYLGNSVDDIDIALNDDLFVRGSDGRVGINTLSPEATLHVAGDLKIDGTCIGCGAWTVSGSDVYRSSGNVGIGTTNPATKLTVADGAIRSSTGEFTYAQINNDANGPSLIGVSNTTAMKPLVIGSYNDEGMASLPGGALGIDFEIGYISSPSTVMSIDPNGNVGIGTSSPTHALDVAGEVGIDSFILHNGNTSAHFGFGGADEFIIRTEGAARFKVHSDGDIQMWKDLYVDGEVGIGTVAPNTKLHVNGPSGESAFRVQVDGNSKLTVASNGGVSIGDYNETPPDNGLYVKGDVGIDGDLNLDGNLDYTGTNIGMSVSGPFNAQSINGAGTSDTTTMENQNESICFLTKVYVNETDTNNEDAGCTISTYLGNWVLFAYAESSDADAYCEARCLNF